MSVKQHLRQIYMYFYTRVCRLLLSLYEQRSIFFKDNKGY